MLVKRTNILFDETLWRDLSKLAKARKTSVAKLVRKAVRDTYFSDKDQEERAKAIDEILKIRKKFKGKIDYKELINYGRKY